MRGAVGGRREAERPPEAGGEGAEAPQADGEADLRYGLVGGAQQRSRALEPACEQVLVRRLAEGAAELAAEVRGREPCSTRKHRHVERLPVAAVGEVLCAEQVPRGRDGSGERRELCRLTHPPPACRSGSRRRRGLPGGPPPASAPSTVPHRRTAACPPRARSGRPSAATRPRGRARAGCG